jgi:hypothetical protein
MLRVVPVCPFMLRKKGAARSEPAGIGLDSRHKASLLEKAASSIKGKRRYVVRARAMPIAEIRGERRL